MRTLIGARRFSKTQYELLASQIAKMEDGLVALNYTLPQRNDILMLIIAQIGMLLAQDSPGFDSLRFHDWVQKQRKERYNV